MRRSDARGFTLLEVMIALAVFVAAALALDSAMGANTRGTLRFEEKTLASWVAANKLVELQLYQQWPATGRQDEETEFAGRKWQVQADVAAGPLPDTRRIDINVGPVAEFGSERTVVSTLTALLVKPPTAEAAPSSTSTTPPSTTPQPESDASPQSPADPGAPAGGS